MKFLLALFTFILKSSMIMKILKGGIIMDTSSEKIYRSKQVGVNITDKMLEKLKKVAAMDGTTYSHKAYQIIKQYLDEHEDEIQAYDEFIKNLKKR